MHWFYIDNDLNHVDHLDVEESKHALKVLRLKQGDKIVVTNGKGQLGEAVISTDRGKTCAIQFEHIAEGVHVPKCNIQLCIAPTKNLSRIEWLVEKLTEIGITSIHFFSSEYSERVNLRMDRLEKIVLSAGKQSKRAFFPTVHHLVHYNELVSFPFRGQKIMAHIDNAIAPINQVMVRGQDSCIFIGPEGGFSSNEVELAKAHQFQLVSLGDFRLRTETAALVGCIALHLNSSNEF